MPWRRVFFEGGSPNWIAGVTTIHINRLESGAVELEEKRRVLSDGEAPTL